MPLSKSTTLRHPPKTKCHRPKYQGCGVVAGFSDSDSNSDSELLIHPDFSSDSDSGSGSDSGSDTKYEINNTLTVPHVSFVQARKRNVTFPIDFGFYSFGRNIFISVIPHTILIASAPPPELRYQIIYLYRFCSCRGGASPRRRPV